MTDEKAEGNNCLNTCLIMTGVIFVICVLLCIVGVIAGSSSSPPSTYKPDRRTPEQKYVDDFEAMIQKRLDEENDPEGDGWSHSITP